MHYLLDGYNILFRRKREGSFEEVREKFIHELDILARALHLHLTLVLDAYKRKEEQKRHHFRSLEVIYTNFGETADDYLYEYIHHLTDSVRKKTILVTSDLELQRKVRAEQVAMLSVSSFFHELEKKIIKRYPVTRSHSTRTVSSQKGTSRLPPLMDTEAWIAIFERR